MLHEWQSHFASQLRALPPYSEAALATLFGAQQHRFSVYRDNFIGSLVDTLAETFPVTRQLLGERFFAVAAADFIRREPPVAARLSRYGSAFPGYLREHAALRELGYVADVASLEWARVESFFAGMPETTVTPETLLGFAEEALPHLVFETAASLRVIVAPTAVLSIWQAHQQVEPQLDGLDPWQAQAVRVLCNRLQGVAAMAITPAHAALLQALQQGADLSAAYEAAAALAADFDLQAALAAELTMGSFARVLAP
ncbi:MAG TPA: DNA-binding domain-containing protein [Terriglobales bacterium]|nr:DNA-binding domain-containing protein [Terriglobales bacterium]